MSVFFHVSAQGSKLIVTLLMQPMGKGKTMATILCSLHLQAKVTLIFAPLITFKGWQTEIQSLIPNAK